MRIVIRTLKNPPSSISAFVFAPGERYINGNETSIEMSAAQYATNALYLDGAVGNGDIAYDIRDVSAMDFAGVIGDNVNDDTSGFSAMWTFVAAHGIAEVTIPAPPVAYKIAGNAYGGPRVWQGGARSTPMVLRAGGNITFADNVLLADATSGPLEFDLPALSLMHGGEEFAVKRLDNTSGNPVTVVPHSGDTIEGSSSVSLSQWDLCRVRAYPTNNVWLRF